MCNTGQLVLVGDRHHGEGAIEYYGLKYALVKQ